MSSHVAPTGTSTSALYADSAAEQDVDMTLAIDAAKDDEEALVLLSGAEPQPRHATELLAAPDAASATATALDSSASSQPAAAATTAGPKTKASGSSNVSAVYRWYEVEESFSAKKREESSIAKCKLCRQQGKLERKTCVRFSKSVTSNLWRHLKENHPDVYLKHAGEKKSVQMHRVMGAKKRGRKKVVAQTPSSGAAAAAAVAASADAAAVNGEQDAAKVQTQLEDGGAQSTTAIRTPVTKKAKRGEHQTPLFMDYSLATVGSALHQRHQAASRPTAAAGAGVSAAGISSVAGSGNFNPEKVREALGYLCLYEMLPFELCSSHAFRNLMVECSGGEGGYVDDSNSFAMFAKEIAFGYAKKMAAEVKVRTVMQMKMTDFSHLMISEWRSSNSTGEQSGSAIESAPPVGYSPRSDNEMVFLALFAVGLDQEFNPYRRCLHVSSIGSYRIGQDKSIAAELAGDKELKKAMCRALPCRYMPQLLALEPPCSGYDPSWTDHKLHLLESVPTVLQHIMIATINGVNVSGSYCLGSNVVAGADISGTTGFRYRRLDQGEYVESSSAAMAVGSSSDAFCVVSAVETTSSILEELPTSLTGHTYRDLMNKVMYLVAHFKQSPKSRMVLRKLAVEQSAMDADSFERLFTDRLREMAISMGGIHSVLALVEDMRAALKKYFFLHKDNDSDFSKLIQLSSLTRYEWARVRYLTVILKPFAEATAKLDGEKYAVSSLIVPSVFTLIEKLRDFNTVSIGSSNASSGSSLAKKGNAEVMEEVPEDIEALRDLAFANLSACFGHMFSVPDDSWSVEKRQTFNLLWSATILDPRTRSFIIKGSLPQHEFWDIVKSEAANIAGTKMKDKGAGMISVTARSLWTKTAATWMGAVWGKAPICGMISKQT